MKNARTVSKTAAPGQTRVLRTPAMLKPIAAALLATGLASPAHAIDTVWFGGTGDWSTGANWSLGIPSASDVAVINSGNATLASNATILGLTQSNGTLGGAGALSVSGASSWTGGSMVDAGSTTFNGALALSGDTRTVTSRGVTFAGTTTWTGGNFNTGSAAALANSGTFLDQNASAASIRYNLGGATSSFTNTGTYTKSGAGTTTITTAFNNNAAGVLNVNAGTLQVTSAFTNIGLINTAAGASFFGSNTTFVNAGTVTGGGTVATHVNGDIVNDGNINPGAGVGELTLDGDLIMGVTGTLNIELASLASSDLLKVTDDVTLSGDLVVVNAGYSAVLGDTFVVLTFDQRLGNSSFSNVLTSGYGSGVTFETIYNTHDVSIRVTAVPEPESWAMLLAGLGLVGFMARRRKQIEA